MLSSAPLRAEKRQELGWHVSLRQTARDDETLRPIRITFGMIVLNGEPFIRYNLRSLYPFAHQIIVVEGACPTAKNLATNDGHSRDGTLEILRQFQREEDPEGKINIVTAEDEGHPNGFWSEKDEGHPSGFSGEKDEMSRAYARRATGNYLWQVDVDEFYRSEDMHSVIEMLRQDPEIKAVTFRVRTFWGGLGYITDGIFLRQGQQDFHRLFAWAPGYQYVTHRPPTVVDEQGRNLRTIRSVPGAETARRGIYLYHYSFLFPFQVHSKIVYYGPLSPSVQSRREAWASNYFDLKKPFFIDDTSVIQDPSWLLRFHGQHPDPIQQLWEDIERGNVCVERRSTDDIERLLRSPWYEVGKTLLPIGWKLLGWARYGSRIPRAFFRRLDSLKLVVLVRFRLACLSLPIVSNWARSKWSLQAIASGDIALRQVACRAQFSEWHPEDLRPKINWYGRQGWRSLVSEPTLDSPPGIIEASDGHGTLLVAARGFFETYTPDKGRLILSKTIQSLKLGMCLFVYAPHDFAFGATSQFTWIPRWEDLYELVAAADGVRVLDFNPGFERNGFFHFIIERSSLEKAKAEPERTVSEIRAGHYFYYKTGASRTLGHSVRVLSASGLRVLQRIVPKTSEYHYLARVPENASVQTNDIAMGHYGPWITTARQRGALTVLYGPGDRFRKEQHEPYYDAMQSRGTFHEQYLACHMAIMQAGGFWRTADPWTYPGLCRWIDLPVSPAVFPRAKKRIAPPGQRVFSFINLYNERAKGAAPAREICKRCSDFQFIAIGCRPFDLPNVREYQPVDNRSARFRQIATQSDFFVAPAWDDPQPGTVAECGSLGLLPIVSEYTGYVLSFPERLDLDDLDQCEAALRTAQAASEEEVQGWQMLNAQYIGRYHRPDAYEDLMLFYLNEALSEFCEFGGQGEC